MNDIICTPVCTPSEAEPLPTSEVEIDERLAGLAKAIAHPARVQILHILSRRTTCMCGDIVGEMTLAQSTVSEHLRILRNARLIKGEIDGPRVCYCINQAVLDQLKLLIQGL
jgi:ArsR family transcriptional regulator